MAVTGYTKSSFSVVANSVFKSYEHQAGGSVEGWACEDVEDLPKRFNSDRN
jgi:hypothetical protein